MILNDGMYSFVSVDNMVEQIKVFLDQVIESYVSLYKHSRPEFDVKLQKLKL